MIEPWTMQECEECGGIGELQQPIPNSQPPDWDVIICYECEGEGEVEQWTEKEESKDPSSRK